jgi:hypothetical protein
MSGAGDSCRQLTGLSHGSVVVVPSVCPRRPGVLSHLSGDDLNQHIALVRALGKTILIFWKFVRAIILNVW